MKIFPLAALSGVLTLCACAETSDPDVDPAAVEDLQGVDRPATMPQTGIAPSLEMSIPQPLRATWRATDGDFVRASECSLDSGNRENFGKVLTVLPETFTIFEVGGSLATVHDRNATSIDATFDITSGDQTSQTRLLMSTPDNGTTLIVVPDGDDIITGRTRYLRCPE